MHLFNRFFAHVFARVAARISSHISSRARGFTLIELLIVIVIIGILAVGFAPTVLNAPKKARDAMRKGHLASIKDAIEAYAVDKGDYPGPLANNGCVTGKIGSDVSQYFQGGIIPKDPSSAAGFGNCFTAGEYNYVKFDTCYAIGAKMEVAGSGNTDKSAPENTFCPNAAPTIGAGSKDYYYVVVKYK